MHSPVWIEARTLRLPDDTTPVELNAHPLFCTIQRTKRVRLTFPVTSQAVYGVLNLLTWPISIIWAVPQGAIDATTLNKQDMIYHYQFDADGKEEMRKINFTFD
mgnify:FL=1